MGITMLDKMTEFRNVAFVFQLSGTAAIATAKEACGNGSGIDALMLVREGKKEPYAYLTACPGKSFPEGSRAIIAALQKDGVPLNPVVRTVPRARVSPDGQYLQSFAADKPFFAASWTRVEVYWRPLKPGISFRVRKMKLTNKGIVDVETAVDFKSLREFEKAVKEGKQPQVLLDRVPHALQDTMWWLEHHTFGFCRIEEGGQKFSLMYTAYPVDRTSGTYNTVFLYFSLPWSRNTVPSFAERQVVIAKNGFSIGKKQTILGRASRADAAVKAAGGGDVVERLMDSYSAIMSRYHHGSGAERAQALLGNKGK